MKTSRVALVAISCFALGFFLGRGDNNPTSSSALAPTSQQQTTKPKPDSPVETTQNPTDFPAQNRPSTQTTPAAQAEINLGSIRQLLTQDKPNQALAQLNVLIQKDYNSAEAWLLKAETAQQLQLAHEAVAAWFHYLRLELNSEKIARGLNSLQKYLLALSGQIHGPSAESDWLITQWNHLLETAPVNYNNNGSAHLALARLYQLAQDDYQTQYHALAAASDASIKNETQAFLAQLDGGNLQQGISLPLQRYGQQYLLEIKLNGESAKLLLDTGASISGLGRDYLSRHPQLVKNTRPIELHTASGVEQSYVFSLDEIQLGDASFNQQLMVALPMSTRDFDGLLGIDLLGKFHFVIDQNKAELQLKPRD